MKHEGYPQGIVYAILGRAKVIEKRYRLPHAAALERSVSEFVSRSSIADRVRASMEIDHYLETLTRRVSELQTSK